MTFILKRDRPKNSIEEWSDGWQAYCDYLESVREQLPKSAYEFATADWHYNFSDHRSPHDSWLEELSISERASGERKQHRLIEIFVLLFAAYHDGYIKLTYKNVRCYSLEKNQSSKIENNDWLYDEIRLSDDGRVLHEIDWVDGHWLIECEDVLYEWKPFGD